jgi:hypothetical protein
VKTQDYCSCLKWWKGERHLNWVSNDLYEKGIVNNTVLSTSADTSNAVMIVEDSIHDFKESENIRANKMELEGNLI